MDIACCKNCEYLVNGDCLDVEVNEGGKRIPVQNIDGCGIADSMYDKGTITLSREDINLVVHALDYVILKSDWFEYNKRRLYDISQELWDIVESIIGGE